MSKILVSFFLGTGEDKLLNFYEGFLDSLKTEGNDVRYIVTNNFLDTPWNGENNLKKNINSSKLESYIQDYAPNLCISFNNSIPDIVVANLGCPIILWHADTYIYFNGKKKLEKNPSRYFYVCPFESDVKRIKKHLSVKDDYILRIIPGTAIQSDDSSVSSDISFIGSMFYIHNSKDLLREVESPSQVMSVAQELCSGEKSLREILSDRGYDDFPDSLNEVNLIDIYSIHQRNSLISNLSDMNLKVYGKSEFFSWSDFGAYLPMVSMCFQDKDVYSLKHNQDIYNQSKISINISHAQAKEGFPWRVFDIMASNSCLISDKRLGIKQFTSEYVDIPMYESIHDARELCKRILKDDLWRSEIVTGSQKCINEKGRWSHRFKEIEDRVPVKIVNDENKIGTLKKIDYRDYLVVENKEAVSQPNASRIAYYIKKVLKKNKV